MNPHDGEGPLLSVIIATDNFESAHQVIESVARQSIASRLEVVLVTTNAEALESRVGVFTEFHGLRVVETQSLTPYSSACACGIRAATAPAVFIAETHAFPDKELAERLLDVLNDWAVGVPGFRNSNPTNSLSWAAFLGDYGAWSANLAAGEVERTPSHDVAIRRSVLMEFGERLEHALGFGDEFRLGVKSRGHRSYFEPSAGIQHVNIDRLLPWIRERYLCGMMIGGYRGSHWTLARRLLYACASPLIPLVILARVRRGISETRRVHRLPAGTIPAIVLAAYIKAAGECRGYLLGPGPATDAGMTAFEIRKVAINAGENP